MEKEEYEDEIWQRPWRFTELIGSLVLVSLSHWENFMDGRWFCCEFKTSKSQRWFSNSVLKTRFELQEGRHFVLFVANAIKVGIYIVGPILLSEDISLNYWDAFDKMTREYGTTQTISAVLVVCIGAFMGFFSSIAACTFGMQVVSMSIPILLASPLAIGVFILDCELDFIKDLTTLPVQCPGGVTTSDHWLHAVFGVAWWLSLLVLTRHVWAPEVDRAANVDRLFINPGYCGVLCLESILLKRRRQQATVHKSVERDEFGHVLSAHYKLLGKGDVTAESPQQHQQQEAEEGRADVARVEMTLLGGGREGETDGGGVTKMLYACATMWHETRTEMVQLLKSVHRLDRDQAVRALANKAIGKVHPDFYNFEAHIFFDDAMEKNEDKRSVLNDWVKLLVGCVEEACSSVQGRPSKVHDPCKVWTPYGGQLIWRMPGGNLLYVHLKDLGRIRNRKRWSQVMYMYYLLGYHLMMSVKPETRAKIAEMDRQQGQRGLSYQDINNLLDEATSIKAQNTFLLALDGDTDFTPGSVKVLLDRMGDAKVAAACGRIHPVGSGPLIWYQKFEYAIGHWLQKAAEHIFGCVLCSPGCFSLFRASALMDTNVMNKYTTEPTEASHFLQYDQGEDRWLCTLLLQQGYRIEYAAAADAYTFAPEGFNEFYNQRRRWMPSTIANLLDLLNSSDKTTRINPNMSTLYIFYQWLLMLMTILGPGTVLMMIAGAIKLVFSMNLVESYLFAVIPAGVYTAVCFLCKQKIQLTMAAVLSVFYAFVMMVVLVGTLYTASTEDIFHPSVIVIGLLLIIFCTAAACHPYEFGCLVHGLLYMIVIPSGYLLLVIYSIVNLNDVSWGTRMVLTKEQKEEAEKKKKAQEEEKRKKKEQGLFTRLFGEIQFNQLTNLLKSMNSTNGQGQMMPSGNPEVESEMLTLLTKIEANTRQLLGQPPDVQGKDANSKGTSTRKGTGNPLAVSTRKAAQLDLAKAQDLTRQASLTEEEKKEEEKRKAALAKKEERRLVRKENRNPIWIHDEALGKGEAKRADDLEWEFWEQFVNKYLLPIRPTKAEKDQTASELRELRNSASFGLIIVNLMWMALNFMFQYTEAAKITLAGGTRYETEESLLGLSFVAVLLLLMLLQMVGMLIHRLGTLQHLLAITEIRLRKKPNETLTWENQSYEAIKADIKEMINRADANGPGAETFPPEFADNDGNNFGMTVIRSSRTVMNPVDAQRFRDSFSRSRRNLALTRSQITGVRRGPSLYRQRGEQNLGSSNRPQLPPRTRPGVRRRFMQSNKFGFTQREIQDMHLTNIVPREEEEDARPFDPGMTAMERLLESGMRRVNRDRQPTASFRAEHVVGHQPEANHTTTFF